MKQTALLTFWIAAGFGCICSAAENSAKNHDEGMLWVPAKRAAGDPVIILTDGRAAQLLTMLQPALESTGLTLAAPKLVMDGGNLDATATWKNADALLKRLTADYKLAATKPHAMCFSASGPQGFQFAFAAPNRCASLLAVGAFPPAVTKEQYAAGTKLPVLLVYGEKDTTSPAERGRKIEELLKNAGLQPRLVLIPEADHMGLVSKHAGVYLKEIAAKPGAKP